VCACATSAPVGPQVIEQIHSSKHVAVVAPDVQLVRHSLSSGDEQLRVEGAQAVSHLSSLMTAELAQRGFGAKNASLTDATTSSIQSAYDHLAYQKGGSKTIRPYAMTVHWPQMSRWLRIKTGLMPSCLCACRDSNDPPGASQAEVGVDLLLAVGPLAPAKAPNASAELTLTLVDGTKGTILWENEVQENWVLTMRSFGSTDMAVMVTKAFETFPQ
jgi:hypothetical protein